MVRGRVGWSAMMDIRIIGVSGKCCVLMYLLAPVSSLYTCSKSKTLQLAPNVGQLWGMENVVAKRA